jgi:6-phosphogluconolactonase/glucosamine-6-phosphate isomerase/deaminase
VDWSRWHVFWADERVVPKEHADSNYKLAMDGFLSKVFAWIIFLCIVGSFQVEIECRNGDHDNYLRG